MAGNVRISTENMNKLRAGKRSTGASIEFTANRILAEYYEACMIGIGETPTPGKPVANTEKEA